MELAHVIFYVLDMKRAIGFYRDTLGRELESESESWTTFRTGACSLALHSTEQRERGVAEPDPTFLVADADAERERLAAAGVEVSEIRVPTATVRVFDARDPDGNRFSIASVLPPNEEDSLREFARTSEGSPGDSMSVDDVVYPR